MRDQLVAEEPAAAGLLAPLLIGRQIKRWSTERTSRWLLYIPWHFPLHDKGNVDASSSVAENAFRKRFPKTFAHISKFRSELMKRDQTEIGIRYEWFCLSRPRPEAALYFQSPKIVFPDIAAEPCFAWDDQGHAVENTAYLIPGPKWLLAVLNSPAAFWFCRQVSNTIRGGFVRFIRQYVEQIPIPQATQDQQNHMLRLVDYLAND
jgi:adenine-specific DNA-methyltransferase